MRFSKWHALGNDYLLVERADLAQPLDAATIRDLCDRHAGIGSDGVLEILTVDGPDADVAIWNPDGSLAELSGNGTRIVARWLLDRTGAREVRVRVGPRVVVARPRPDGAIEQEVGRVDVGAPETIEVGGRAVELTAVSVGNPHAVVRTDDPSSAALVELGPAIEGHERFPDRTNVQLVRVDGPHDLTVAVWERGAGETRSSGTSAVAAAAASVANGWCESPVSVHLPGGTLLVELDREHVARLIGPAVEIFRGELV
jgi:diaminopimelate epimerase